MEDGVALDKPKKGEKHPCLESKRALKALHAKCLEYTKQMNVSYIDQSILTQLLGGTDDVKPNVVADIMTYMVSMVCFHRVSPTLEYGSVGYGCGRCVDVQTDGRE